MCSCGQAQETKGDRCTCPGGSHEVDQWRRGQADGDVGEDGDAQVAGPTITSERHFPPIQWEFSTDEDMQALLAFEKKGRVSAFGKGLLALRCMGTEVEVRANAVDSIFIKHHANYKELRNLAEVSRAEYDDLVRMHADKAEINPDEENIELAVANVPRTTGLLPNLPPGATFASQTVYDLPSQFIRAMVAAFPQDEQLTFD